MLIPISGDGYPIRLVQITDCHLEDQQGGTLLGVDTDASLQDVIDLLRLNPQPIDCVLFTGDLATHGKNSAYQRFLQRYVSQFPEPTACLPGNHDDLSNMSTELGSLLHKTIEIGDWLLVLLDSRIPGSEFGNVDDSEMLFLQQTLQQNPHKPTLVLLHHQVIPVGCRWLDNHAIRSAPRFQQLVLAHSQVKAVVSGHVHQDTRSRHGHIHWITTPSTCVQFKTCSDDFAVDLSAPGYRWFDLYADGRFETGVVRVENKIYSVDLNSSGY